jgi:hypothetical protein
MLAWQLVVAVNLLSSPLAASFSDSPFSPRRDLPAGSYRGLVPVPVYVLAAPGQYVRKVYAPSCCYQRGFHLMKLWNGFDAAC